MKFFEKLLRLLVCAAVLTLAWVAPVSAAEVATPRFTSVAVGRSHTAAVQADGSLWVWGIPACNPCQTPAVLAGRDRSLPLQVVGTGYKSVVAMTQSMVAVKHDGSLWAIDAYKLTANQVIEASDVSAVATGAGFTLVLKTDGSIWTAGSNYLGQLGDGTVGIFQDSPIVVTVRTQSQFVQIGSGFTAIAAGNNHALALKADGSLWAWGANASGQLGDGSTTLSSRPKLVGTGFKGIAAGGNRSMAVRLDGSLWGWGDNANGQLGDGSTVSVAIPQKVGDGYDSVSTSAERTVALKQDGTLWHWGLLTLPQAVGDAAKAGGTVPQQIGTGFIGGAAGVSHAAGLKADGSLWMWGDNSQGQLGIGENSFIENPRQIGSGYRNVAASLYHSAALSSDGRLRTWGSNLSGELGDGSTLPSFDAKAVGDGFVNLAIGASTNDIYYENANDSGGFTLGVKSDGSLWAWGDNRRGQLGNSQPLQRQSLVPLRVGEGFANVAAGGGQAFGVKRDGSLWAWGINPGAAPGAVGANTDRFAPVQIGSDYVAVAAGNLHAIGLKRDGTVWTWGQNIYGQLGDGSKSANDSIRQAVPKQVGAGYAAISAGTYFSMGIKTDGSLWAWGRNDDAQLGDGTVTESLVPKQVGVGFTQVSAGRRHALGIKTDGSLWEWGTKLDLSNCISGGFGPSVCYGRSFIRQQAPKQIATSVQDASAGSDYSLAVKTDGSLWAWGAPGYALGVHTYRLTPQRVTTPIADNYNTKSDCLFDWAAAGSAAYFAPAAVPSQVAGRWYFRYYGDTRAYLAVSIDTGHVFYLGPLLDNTLLDLGLAFDWYVAAGCQR